MNLMSIVLIAIGLAMDAFAVAITTGIILKKDKDLMKNSLIIAGYFGFFQALMPLIGWFVGLQFKEYIEKLDHWIAFILLSFIGVKMIYEAIKNKDEQEEAIDPLNKKTLLFLAIATSIDALIVGLSFAFLEVSITSATLIIGVITFIICLIGVYLGKKFGQIFKGKAELFGGGILIIIGFRILLEHTNLLYVLN